eukprot:3937305-Rhodomonas_salina.8
MSQSMRTAPSEAWANASTTAAVLLADSASHCGKHRSMACAASPRCLTHLPALCALDLDRPSQRGSPTPASSQRSPASSWLEPDPRQRRPASMRGVLISVSHPHLITAAPKLSPARSHTNCASATATDSIAQREPGKTSADLLRTQPSPQCRPS